MEQKHCNPTEKRKTEDEAELIRLLLLLERNVAEKQSIALLWPNKWSRSADTCSAEVSIDYCNYTKEEWLIKTSMHDPKLSLPLVVNKAALSKLHL